MNRRTFVKRSLTALGLAVAMPLMPSVARVAEVEAPMELTVDMLVQAKRLLDGQAMMRFEVTGVDAWGVNKMEVLHIPGGTP